MKLKMVKKKLPPYNFLRGNMAKKRCFFMASAVVVLLAFFVYGRYDGQMGNIDAKTAKTDALAERLEQQLCMFDGVNAAEVAVNDDGSVLIQLEAQAEFAFEEQVKEYAQKFVACMPEDILLTY